MRSNLHQNHYLILTNTPASHEELLTFYRQFTPDLPEHIAMAYDELKRQGIIYIQIGS
ncbi:hypothetical protein ACVFZR_01150 [Lacticaseibacillus paracasei]